MTDIAKHVHNDRDEIFSQLKALVSFNSVHGQPELKDETVGAAKWVEDAFCDAGFSVEAIETEDDSIALVGEKKGAENAPTVLLYSHYDVVPAGDKDEWATDPFALTERESADGSTRWYGRGAADCKGNIAMHLAALRAVETNGGSDLNLKVLIEGSEEQGGEGLSGLIAKRPELFAADVILIADAGNAAVGTPTLVTSLRGGAQVKVTVSTLDAPVHSGQFGGAAPDAVKALMRAIDSLTDEHGRTQIDGIDCTATWEGQGYPAEQFRADAKVLEGTALMGEDGVDAVADLIWARPSIAVTGFTSTPVDKAVNAVAHTAQANLNVRVPATMDSQEVADAVAAHLKSHVPWGAHINVDIWDVNRGFSTDPSSEALSTLGQCLAEAYGTETVTMGMGGSIPLTVELQEAHPTVQIALFGVEEPTCTIHSANESVDPGEIEHVAAAEALFLTHFGK